MALTTSDCVPSGQARAPVIDVHIGRGETVKLNVAKPKVKRKKKAASSKR